MSEERLERLENTTATHENRLTQIEILLEKNTLQISQNTDHLRLLNDSVLRLSSLMEVFTERVSEDLPTLNAAVERLDRLVDYLIRQDGKQNNPSDRL